MRWNELEPFGDYWRATEYENPADRFRNPAFQRYLVQLCNGSIEIICVMKWHPQELNQLMNDREGKESRESPQELKSLHVHIYTNLIGRLEA